MNATREVTDNKNSKKLEAQKPKKAKKISDERKLIKTLNKSFEDAKRKNAAIKKTMKDLSAVITEMLSSPNEKMQTKLVKKLAFYGFNYADGILTNNVTSVKVKIPKIKSLKESLNEEKSSDKKGVKKLRKRKVSKDAIEVDSASDIAVNAEVVDAVKSNEEGEVANLNDEHESVEPTDEEFAAIESEELDEEDDELDEELNDPELDEDDRESLREARRVERDYERDCRSFAHNDIYQAMEDNGDFS